MSISKVEIVNKGLYKIGAARIGALGENSKFGLIAADIYPSIRDAVQEAHPWTFCIEWLTLEPVTGAEHPIYGQGYQLPENVLRPLEVHENPGWRHEKKILYADGGSSPLVKCIVRIEDESQFTATFVEAFACRLGMEFSYSATNSAALFKACEDAYEKELSLARTFNSQSAGTPPRGPVRNTTWTRGRGLRRYY